jgi:hypothetical protein
MSNEQVVPETKGVTVKLFAAVDRGSETEGMEGRQLRMRMVDRPYGVLNREVQLLRAWYGLPCLRKRKLPSSSIVYDTGRGNSWVSSLGK